MPSNSWQWARDPRGATRGTPSHSRTNAIRTLHPLVQVLSELCGGDRLTYVRLIAGLVRMELSKSYHDI